MVHLLLASALLLQPPAGGAPKPGAAPAQPGKPASSPPAAAAPKAAAATPSTLDAACGWVMYSGEDAGKGWRGYNQAEFPKQGWTMGDGTLTHGKGAGGGDIITAEPFGDFEFECAFRTTPKANSGIIWRIAEKHDTTWQTGPEFQVLDDAGEGVSVTDIHSSGAMYDLYPPAGNKVCKPAGEWNQARIRLRNGVIQHWLNGTKVVEARLFEEADGRPTREWLDKIAGSKFKVYEGFGIQAKGHIGLQDHGDEVAFKDVRIRSLDTFRQGEIKLFNGTDLDGWKAVLPDGGKMEDVWSVKDGVMICKGNPIGYIRTTRDFKNYVLRLQWRFNPETKKAGNSGVLLRMVGADKVWPRSIEAQLQSGSAGDFWNIDEFKMTADAGRTNGRNTKKTHGAERPVGEWNDYEIIVNKGTVILKVNGEELNRAQGAEELAGKICLQSEGAEIQFREIWLMPLE